MEGGESILDSIYEEDSIEDVEMLDIEEGECIEENPHNGQGHSSGRDVNVVNRESHSKNRRRRNKKINRNRNTGPAPHVTDINRFVLEACKRLKEKKSYMVYTAVGCLGVSALGDLIKEVDAIQACGGQMTADGKRHRTGGGVLWSIIKTREPKAYKEIMKRAKDFEGNSDNRPLVKNQSATKVLLRKPPMLSLIRPLVFQLAQSLSFRFKVTQAIPMAKRNVYLFIIGSGFQSHMKIFLERI